MSKLELKRKAIKLRQQGKTYLEIQKILKKRIPKSTLSCWCTNIKLPKEYQDRIQRIVLNNAEKGRGIALVVNRVKREKYLKSIIDRNKYFATALKDKDIAKIALAMLYLGEGAKWKSHRGLLLGSSDPDIVKIYIKLLQKCYNISKTKMRAKVLYRFDQNIDFLITFWSHIIGIPKHHFYNTKPDPRTIGKETKKKDYRGVCVITCGGTEIQLELDIIARMFIQK